MKRFLIPATTLLILLIAVLAIPSDSPKIYQKSGWINEDGGTINVPGGTKVIIPEGALDENTYITVTVEVYKDENKIHYIFGPSGTVFNELIEIKVPWSYLKDYDGDLELWSLNDDDEWTLVEDAIIDQQKKRYILYIDHFSEYYFPRP